MGDSADILWLDSAPSRSQASKTRW